MNNEETRDEMIIGLIPIASIFAKRFANYPELKEEIYHTAIEAVIKAVDSFDSHKGKLKPYAQMIIWMAVKDCYSKWKTKQKRMPEVRLFEILTERDASNLLEEKELIEIAEKCCKDKIDIEILYDNLLENRTTLTKIGKDYDISRQAISARAQRLLSRIEEVLTDDSNRN